MKIKFIARNPYMWKVALKPHPASEALPGWWKNMYPYSKSPNNPSGKKIEVNNYLSNATFKKCVPMLDSLTSGYIIPLWSDVQISQVYGEARFSWRVKPDVFQHHGSESDQIPPPEGYSNQVVKYLNPWIPRTPKGYSVLVTQPFGYINSPFYSVPAVIDSDTSTLDILPPMWVKEGFEGIVEKGTPMVQITPFKRENWKAEFEYLEAGEIEAIEDRNFNSTLVNHYVKNHWAKKKYK